MKVQLGVGLIVGGFIIPIIAFFIVRKILQDRRNRIQSEIFSKEGHKNQEIFKDGQKCYINIPQFNNNNRD